MSYARPRALSNIVPRSANESSTQKKSVYRRPKRPVRWLIRGQVPAPLSRARIRAQHTDLGLLADLWIGLRATRRRARDWVAATSSAGQVSVSESPLGRGPRRPLCEPS